MYCFELKFPMCGWDDLERSNSDQKDVRDRERRGGGGGGGRAEIEGGQQLIYTTANVRVRSTKEHDAGGFCMLVFT